MQRKDLDENCAVNIESKEGCNELHYPAANINAAGAVEVAKILLDKKVDLSLQESRYGNSALFSLCIEALKQRKKQLIS